jgi:hypothetical protein
MTTQRLFQDLPDGSDLVTHPETMALTHRLCMYIPLPRQQQTFDDLLV